MTSTYLYDALGRRVGQTASGLTTQYVYDMLNVAQEQYTGGTVADMLAGLGLDQNFARTDTSGSYAMLPDLLGSTLAMVNSAGGISTSYQYGPFGQTTMTGTSSTNPFQYIGREMDPTGLYFMRARYYNPIAQRFISQDPIGLAGGQSNFYAYAFNSPMNWKDPMGLSEGGGGGAPKPTPPSNWYWSQKDQQWGDDIGDSYGGITVLTGSGQGGAYLKLDPLVLGLPLDVHMAIVYTTLGGLAVTAIAGPAAGVAAGIALAYIYAELNAAGGQGGIGVQAPTAPGAK